ncbi:aminopeptidase N isoform X1 [Lasioglossum baleicum]|uniref:aminopeptidase N isoform X1 n=2 Tax=Lasioglossum baleicum TaxID=434251 RepID=UPI003FCDDC1C
MKIAKSTMRWIPAIAGLVLILVLLQDAEAIPRTKWRRSIDLDDIFNQRSLARLPAHVVPTRYELKLRPFMENNVFKGDLKLNVTWIYTSDQITLNVHPDLKIDDYDVRIVQPSLEERENGWPMLDVHVLSAEQPTEKRHYFVLKLQEMLKNGTMCEVSIKFTGQLSTNETSGLFKHNYVDALERKYSFVGAYLGFDQAQKMFPCMDEPPYKANFKLSVLHPRNMTARSNTPTANYSDDADVEDQIWSHFEETPEIAPYQLALAVADFRFVSLSPELQVDEMNGTRLEVKIWGRVEYINALRHVPNKVVTIINYLQKYFNSSILLPKLDLMAVPSYSAAKASDSWGLMLFKESELSSPYCWNTAYELAYQWIGQYITTYIHWDDGQINKALNSFLASQATVDINPDEMEGKWPMTMLYSLYYEFGKADPFSRVAGIRNEATSSKIELAFRMFNYTLGKDLLQKGIRIFIKKHSEGPRRLVMMGELYNILYEVAKEADILPKDLQISSIAGKWVIRDRVPLVTVIRDYETKAITFNQKVYLREAPPASTSKLSFTWDIPLVIVSENKWELDKPCRLWMTSEPKNLTIPDTYGEDNFIIVNPEEIGMFLVNYDRCNWRMLSEYLQGPNRKTIPVLTRAKLIHDAWNLAYAGELCFEIALNMTLSLKEERSHVVWEPVFMMIDHIGRRIEGTDVYPKFEQYVQTLLTPLFLELNESDRTDEPSWKTHMRSMAKHFLCRAGYAPCVQEARDEYKKWLTNEEPDKGNPVANEFICPVFKWGSEEEWEFGLQRVINFPQNSPERKQSERTYLLKTLAGCPKDKNKIERLLNVTILDQNGNFSDSDIHLIFSTLTGGSAGYTTLFNFLSDHWDTVKHRFENKTHLWDGMINSATASFNTQEGLDSVSELYKNRQDEFDTASHIIKEALKLIKHETEWSKKNLPVIEAWLDENLPNNLPTATQSQMCEMDQQGTQIPLCSENKQ